MHFFTPLYANEGPEGEVDLWLYTCLTSALNWGGWSTPRFERFTVGKIYSWVQALAVPMHLGLKTGSLYAFILGKEPHYIL